MRGSPNRELSDGSLVLLTVLAMAAVIKHATVTPVSELVMQSVMLAIVAAVVFTLLKYNGVSRT